jgi:hypothetical protein
MFVGVSAGSLYSELIIYVCKVKKKLRIVRQTSSFKNLNINDKSAGKYNNVLVRGGVQPFDDDIYVPLLLGVLLDGCVKFVKRGAFECRATAPWSSGSPPTT